jgi:hypothetical protein
LDFIKEEKFIDQLSNYWLLMTDSVQWNLFLSTNWVGLSAFTLAGTESRAKYTDSRLWIAGVDAKVRPLSVELSGFYPKDNARDHHTGQFELVHDSTPTPVFRRGLPFFFAVRFARQFDSINDVIRLQFGFGECQQCRTSRNGTSFGSLFSENVQQSIAHPCGTVSKIHCRSQNSYRQI